MTANTLAPATDFYPSLSEWRGMEIAKEQGVKATRVAPGIYRVASKSEPGKSHRVTVDEGTPRVLHCTDCPAWEHHGFCKHAGSSLWGVKAIRNLTVHVPPKVDKAPKPAKPAARAETDWTEDVASMWTPSEFESVYYAESIR